MWMYLGTYYLIFWHFELYCYSLNLLQCWNLTLCDIWECGKFFWKIILDQLTTLEVITFDFFNSREMKYKRETTKRTKLELETKRNAKSLKFRRRIILFNFKNFYNCDFFCFYHALLFSHWKIWLYQHFPLSDPN